MEQEIYEDFVGQMTDDDVIDLMVAMGLAFTGDREEVKKHFFIQKCEDRCRVFISHPYVEDLFIFSNFRIIKDLSSYAQENKNQRASQFCSWMDNRFLNFFEQLKKQSKEEKKAIMDYARLECSNIDDLILKVSLSKLNRESQKQ